MPFFIFPSLDETVNYEPLLKEYFKLKRHAAQAAETAAAVDGVAVDGVAVDAVRDPPFSFSYLSSIS